METIEEEKKAEGKLVKGGYASFNEYGELVEEGKMENKLEQLLNSLIEKGYKINKWTSLGEVKTISNCKCLLCKCDCGTIKYVKINDLIKGRTKGCVKCKGPSWKTHGMTGTRIYNIRTEMKQRCENPKCKSYKWYGERGIKIEWNSFEEFYNDMYPTYKEGLTIDRIDVNGNYCKDNCRWASYKEQMNNTRQNTKYKYGYDFRDLAKKYNLSRSHIKNLVRKFGHDIDKTIYYLEHDKREYETYQGKTAEERARELGWHSGASFRQRLQRNGYSLEEFVKGFLSGKYKKRCGNYYKN